MLFDEIYTDLYQINTALQQMKNAERMVFIGTSFSVNITQMALEIAMKNNTPIEIVDPQPCHVLHRNVTYHAMTASEYIARAGDGNTC